MNFDSFVFQWERNHGVALFGHLGCCAYLVVSVESPRYAEILRHAREMGFTVEEFKAGEYDGLPNGGATIGQE